MHLDEEKLEALRSWGERLRQTSGEEYAAVGRAILLLVEEIDRLHIELWHARIGSGGGIPAEAEEPPEDEEAPAARLHERLQRALRRHPGSSPREHPGPEAEDSESAAQAWIASLRREE